MSRFKRKWQLLSAILLAVAASSCGRDASGGLIEKVRESPRHRRTNEALTLGPRANVLPETQPLGVLSTESNVHSFLPSVDKFSGQIGHTENATDASTGTDLSVNVASASTPTVTDAGVLFWLSDGYDALTGQRRESCLDTTRLQLRSYPVRQSRDWLDIVTTAEEFAFKLNIDFNADASGAFHGVMLTPSIKTTILRETQMSATTMVAVAEFRFIKDDIVIYDSEPALSESAQTLLKTDAEAFRSRCGDEFVRSIKTGASLYLVFRAEQKQSSTNSATSVQDALKVGFTELISASTALSLTKEQKQILNNFRISARCYAEGTSAHPCADYQLNLSDIKIGDTSLLDRIAAAKKALASEADDAKGLTAIALQRERYRVPASFGRKGPNSVFYNYTMQLTSIRSWLKTESAVNQVCTALPELSDLCDLSQETLGHAIASCADQALWPTGECRAPKSGDLDNLLKYSDGGQVTLFEHTHQGGKALVLELHDLFSRSGDGPRPGVLYSLHDGAFGFGYLADRVSSVQQELINGWQLELYEHPDGSGRRFVIHGGLPSTTEVGWFNDKASSFRIVRAPAL